MAGLLAVQAANAASFRNLGFDEAVTNRGTFMLVPDRQFLRLVGIGPVEDFMPGWRVFSGATFPAAEVGYDPSGFPWTPIIWENISRSSLYSSSYGPRVNWRVDGAYSFGMSSPVGNKEFAIEQDGEVPADARLLNYRISNPADGRFVPSINGQPLTFATGGDGRVFYDVSPFAGVNVTLRLTLDPSVFPPGSGSREAFIDSIEFVVPEPGTWVLLLAGAMILSPAICRTTSARQRRRPTANYRGSR
jgi:hypothetical protein